MKGFNNVNVYIEGKGIVKTNITFDSKIVGLEEIATEEIEKISEDFVIVPGFIDEHTHGANGSDAMDGTEKDLLNIATSIPQEGTTTFLATTMTQSPENICKALKAAGEYISKDIKEGAKVAGVHLEGPFISPKHVGAQPLEYVAKPSIETFKKYNEVSLGNIKIVTLAPEMEGAYELAEYLRDIGVVPSIGHTGAKYIEAKESIKHGFSNVTHTYNAQTGLHHRDVGVVGTALLEDELNCELICDTIHVSVPAIKLVVKNKPHQKVTLITDSMRAKHLSDGESELGGQLVIVKNGEARLVDGTLAGSILKMNDAIKNVVTKCGVKFEDAIDFATINPAKNLSLDEKIGSIKVGKDANFAIINRKTFEILMTIREGNVIFHS